MSESSMHEEDTERIVPVSADLYDLQAPTEPGQYQRWPEGMLNGVAYVDMLPDGGREIWFYDPSVEGGGDVYAIREGPRDFVPKPRGADRSSSLFPQNVTDDYVSSGGVTHYDDNGVVASTNYAKVTTVVSADGSSTSLVQEAPQGQLLVTIHFP